MYYVSISNLISPFRFGKNFKHKGTFDEIHSVCEICLNWGINSFIGKLRCHAFIHLLENIYSVLLAAKHWANTVSGNKDTETSESPSSVLHTYFLYSIEV